MLLLLLAATAAAFPPIASIASGLVAVSAPDPSVYCPLEKQAVVAVSETRLVADSDLPGTGNVTLVGVWQQELLGHPENSDIPPGIIAASSFDGGRTWTDSVLPFSTCSAKGLPLSFPSDEVVDPWVSIGPDGLVYASAVDEVRGPQIGNAKPLQSALVAVSRDAGRSWSNAQAIPPGSLIGADKDSVTADPAAAGTAYLVWSATPSQPSPSDRGNDGLLSVTRDAGRTWSPAKIIVHAGGGGSLGHQILADPRSGLLYDIFLQESPEPEACAKKQAMAGKRTRGGCRAATRPEIQTSIAFVVSRNGGATWSRAHIVRAVRLPNQIREGPPRTAPVIPEGAIDPRTGKIYLIWEGASTRPGKYGQLVIVASTDHGAHWAVTARLDPPKGRRIGEPSIAVAANHEVGVNYYSIAGSRHQPIADYWFVGSPNGAGFGAPTHIAGPFVLSASQYRGGAFFLGDYQGLAATGANYYSLFVVPSDRGAPGRVVSTFVPANFGSQGAGR